jgi:two-component system cell cycle sensor histidine kinase/response regulator CckA
MEPEKMSSPPRILLVEDNEHDRLAFRRAFRNSHVSCEITECVRAEDALERLRANASSFDVVVVDYSLPGITGLDFCKEVLHEKLPLPLVLLTGRGSEELAVSALKAGVDDYIVKDSGRGYLDLLPVVLPQVLQNYGNRIARKRAEEACRKAHDELEQRVKDRTAELARANEQLKLEIEERKHAEEALKESEERFRGLSENAPVIIFTLGLDGAVTYLNPAFEKVLGYKREEGLGRQFVAFAMQVDAKNYVNLFKKIMDAKTTIRDESIVLIHKDGSARLLTLSASPNVNRAGEVTGMVGLLKDITEKRKLKGQFRQCQKMEALGNLCSGIADSFNNLLMAIQGKTSLMLLDITPLHPLYQGLKDIQRQVQSGVKLTRQLLGYSKEATDEAKPINLNEVVEKTSETFGKIRKEITVHLELAEGLPAIEADQAQIEQVLLNLFVNAADAMPGGGDLILKTMNVSQKDMKGKVNDPRPGNYVLLMVTDTGVGMDKETVDYIFEPFFTTKKTGHGTGLGLAAVHDIIKGHGGYIDVESTKGYRTTFSIYLPEAENPSYQAVRSAEEFVKGTGTILLVDSDKDTLGIGQEWLEAMGYCVLTAKDGREVVDVYRRNRDAIDMVLLDMVMPSMSGGRAYDKMKEINPNVKVLLCSGYGVNGQATEMMQRGCRGFIQKPFTMRELSQKIREVLETDWGLVPDFEDIIY